MLARERCRASVFLYYDVMLLPRCAAIRQPCRYAAAAPAAAIIFSKKASLSFILPARSMRRRQQRRAEKHAICAAPAALFRAFFYAAAIFRCAQRYKVASCARYSEPALRATRQPRLRFSFYAMPCCWRATMRHFIFLFRAIRHFHSPPPFRCCFFLFQLTPYLLCSCFLFAHAFCCASAAFHALFL